MKIYINGEPREVSPGEQVPVKDGDEISYLSPEDENINHSYYFNRKQLLDIARRNQWDEGFLQQCLKALASLEENK